MSSRTLHGKFLLAGILGSVFSSIAWITEQETLRYLSPLTVAAVAPLVAGILMAPYALRYHRVPTRDEIRRLQMPFLAVLLMRNIFGVLIFTSALTMTSSAKVMFLTKIEPYVVLFLHWLLYKERVPSRDMALLVVHVIGAVILSTGGEFRIHVEQLGDILVLIGIVANALMYRPGRMLAEAWGAGFVTTIGSLLAGILLLPFALYFHLDDFSLHGEHLTGYCYLFFTVIIFYIISTTLWFYSLKGIEPWLNSALRCVGPVVAAPIAWYFFAKPLTVAQIFGAFLVVLTSALLVKRARNKSPESEPESVESEVTATPLTPSSMERRS